MTFSHFPAEDKGRGRERDKESKVNSFVTHQVSKNQDHFNKKLYQQSLQVIRRTPKQQADSPLQTQKAAQLAANLTNNYRSAIARLIQNLPVAKINDSKLEILWCLHPKSLGLGCFKKGHNTRSKKPNRKCIVFSSEQIVFSLCRPNRGKAPGVLGDSLDIYIKTAKSLNLNSTADQERAKVLASFFSRVTNCEIPPKFQRLQRVAYLVALKKDASDPNNLRTLGVPCAICCITAAAILSCFHSIMQRELVAVAIWSSELCNL